MGTDTRYSNRPAKTFAGGFNVWYVGRQPDPEEVDAIFGKELCASTSLSMFEEPMVLVLIGKYCAMRFLRVEKIGIATFAHCTVICTCSPSLV